MRVGEVVLDRYRIERVLGEGGMGVVVAATDLALDRGVALKLLRGDRAGDHEAGERVLREARAAVQLRGEHTGRVHDVERLPTGEPILVMELLDGEDLARRVARGALPPREAAGYVLQACEGVAEAHALGIVHRDIKPSNLFLANDVDGGCTLKVIDFGVAKDTTANDATLTKTTSVIGSVAYMSPEQLRKRAIDARSDVWSLGVVLYELVSGVPPFPAESITDASIRIAVEPPAPLPPAVPREIVAVILRCLQKDPAGRYTDVAELAAALVPFADGGAEAAARVARTLGKAAPAPVVARPPAPTAQPPARKSRRRAAMLGGGLAVAVAGVGAALALGAFDRAPAAREPEPAALAKPDPSTIPSLAEPPPTPEPRLAAHDAVPADELDYRREGNEPHRPASKDPRERTAGILGSTALQQGGAFASLTGTGDISSGFDDTNIYGGLLGNEAGEMNGGFGYGSGSGGGGTGWGTIGTGRYGTIGRGGTGTGYGVGGGRGGMRGQSAAVPTVSIGQPVANGDLDKAIIRRYIKRNIQKIQYCYEKQLLDKPGIAGTVSTQFFIEPTGAVSNSTASGVDPAVASCVAGVIKGIEFPKPKGGGGVQVNYPFTFRPADTAPAAAPAAGSGSATTP